MRVELGAARLPLFASLALTDLTRAAHPKNGRRLADPKARGRATRRKPANAASITRSRKSWL